MNFTDWDLHDVIFTLACSVIGYEVVDGRVYYQGAEVPYFDYESANLNRAVPFEDDEIDAVLVFGDGTVELHLKNEQEAYNWSEFSRCVRGEYGVSILQGVIEELKKC